MSCLSICRAFTRCNRGLVLLLQASSLIFRAPGFISCILDEHLNLAFYYFIKIYPSNTWIQLDVLTEPSIENSVQDSLNLPQNQDKENQEKGRKARSALAFGQNSCVIINFFPSLFSFSNFPLPPPNISISLHVQGFWNLI